MSMQQVFFQCFWHSFIFNCTDYTRKHKNMPCYLRWKAADQAAISLSIAHPKKASHGLIRRGTTLLVAPLPMPIIISKYCAFSKILIFRLNCPFKLIFHLYSQCWRRHLPLRSLSAGCAGESCRHRILAEHARQFALSRW